MQLLGLILLLASSWYLWKLTSNFLDEPTKKDLNNSFNNLKNKLSEELIIWVNITIEIIKKTKRMEVTFIYRKKLIIKKIIPRITVTIAPSTNKSFQV